MLLKGLNHVATLTKDLDRLAAFYAEIFDAPLVRDGAEFPDNTGPRLGIIKIGDYAELEGSAEWIDLAAARLGVEPAKYITLSYGRLFDLWREVHHSAAEDLTFAAVADPSGPKF